MLRSSEEGFTIAELLVAMLIFSLISTTFMMTMLNGNRGAETAQNVVQISEEARLGLNRMIRDTREADEIVEAAPDRFRVLVNFNNDTSGSPPTPLYENPNPGGSYEDLIFEYNAAEEMILLNGEVLLEGVLPNGTDPIFEFTSNVLEFDWNADGLVTWDEIDVASSPVHGVVGVGNNNATLDDGEWPFLSGVRFSLVLRSEDRSQEFVGQAELRNFKYAPVTP